MIEAYLKDRGSAPGSQDRQVMGWMGMPVPHDAMPGLANADDMRAFLGASGADLDRRFATLMVAHHKGGIHMADYAAAHASDPAVADLASAMVTKQTIETTDLEQFLGEAP